MKTLILLLFLNSISYSQVEKLEKLIFESECIISVNVLAVLEQSMYGWSMTSQDIYCSVKEIYKGEKSQINDTISFKMILYSEGNQLPAEGVPTFSSNDYTIFLAKRNDINTKFEIEEFPNYKFIEYPSYNLVDRSHTQRNDN